MWFRGGKGKHEFKTWYVDVDFIGDVDVDVDMSSADVDMCDVCVFVALN